MATSVIVLIVMIVLIYKLVEKRCILNSQMIEQQRQMTQMMPINDNNHDKLKERFKNIDITGASTSTHQELVPMFVRLD